MNVLGFLGQIYMFILLALLFVGFGLAAWALIGALIKQQSPARNIGQAKDMKNQTLNNTNNNNMDKKTGGFKMANNGWFKLAVFSFVGILISAAVLGFTSANSMSGNNMNMQGMQMGSTPMNMQGGMNSNMPMNSMQNGMNNGMPMNNMQMNGAMNGYWNMQMNPMMMQEQLYRMQMQLNMMQQQMMNMQNNNMNGNMQMQGGMMMPMGNMPQNNGSMNNSQQSSGGGMMGMM